jgi:hypothetical protein
MTINLDQYTNTLNVTDTATNADINLTTKGTGAVNLNTGGGTQFSVANTASATNYFATTGSNGGTPALYSAGASTNIGANFVSKGTGALAFYTNGSVAQFVVSHTASAVNYVQVSGASTGNRVSIAGAGSDSNVGIDYFARGTSPHVFSTNGVAQFLISNTTSAVNYVQVTGATTTNGPAITAQGSDSDIGIIIRSKGIFNFGVQNGSGLTSFVVNMTAGSIVNYLEAKASTTGNAVQLSALGSDTNIDLTLTPKGTGNVRFGTYTANMALTIQGYVEIKDSGGTVRRLAVIA